MITEKLMNLALIRNKFIKDKLIEINKNIKKTWMLLSDLRHSQKCYPAQ